MRLLASSRIHCRSWQLASLRSPKGRIGKKFLFTDLTPDFTRPFLFGYLGGTTQERGGGRRARCGRSDSKPSRHTGAGSSTGS